MMKSLSEINQRRIDALEEEHGYDPPYDNAFYYDCESKNLYVDKVFGPPAMSNTSLSEVLALMPFHDKHLIVIGTPSENSNPPLAEGVKIKDDNAPGGHVWADYRGTRIPGGQGDTMTFMGKNTGAFSFHGFDIGPSSRAGIITLDENGPYELNFYDCTLNGGYDHSTNTGFSSKWGAIMHRWGGVFARCKIFNIKYEHAIYPHTLASDTLFYDCHFRRTGRTSIQVCGRDHESGYSDHTLTISNCLFEDSGLHGGGSTLTLGGTDTVEVLDTTCTLGADAGFLQQWLQSHPTKKAMGQGHLVNWSDLGRQDNVRILRLANITFLSAPKAGTAACAQLKAMDELRLEGEIYMKHGYSPKALEFLGSDWTLNNQTMPGDITIDGVIGGYE